jgi:predicted RNA-binding protein with TRAM domain
MFSSGGSLEPMVEFCQEVEVTETVGPDEHRDVIVQHVTRADAGGAELNRWVVFLGQTKRGEMDDSHRALVFARLLADLSQGRVWILHENADGLQPLDARSLRGCSCC